MPLDRDIELSVMMEIDNIEAAKRDASDLAWEHAKSVASAFDLDLGSDEHIRIHKKLSDGYEECVNYLMFFMSHAFQTLEVLFATQHISINSEDGPVSDDDASANLGALAQIICSSYMHLAAGYKGFWPTNDMLPKKLVSSFYFTEKEIQLTEEEQ